MLANRLKILLAERDLSIKDVVSATKISRSAVSNIVNNPFANISTINVDKLCNFLKVSPKDFYDYFPWRFSMGASLRSKKLKYRFNEDFEVGYFWATAFSGSEKIETDFSISLFSSKLEEKTPDLVLTIENPSDGHFDKLYDDMSPIFRHQIRNNVIRLMQNFCVDLNGEYGLVNIYKDADRLKIHVKMNGENLSAYPVEFFNASFEYKMNDLLNHTLAKKALDDIKNSKK